MISSIGDGGARTTQISVARHLTLKNGPNADQCSHASYAKMTPDAVHAKNEPYAKITPDADHAKNDCRRRLV